MRQGDGRSGKEPQVPSTTESAEKKFGSPFEGVQATVKAIFGGDKAKVPTPPAREEDAGGAAADTVEDSEDADDLEVPLTESIDTEGITEKYEKGVAKDAAEAPAEAVEFDAEAIWDHEEQPAEEQQRAGRSRSSSAGCSARSWTH